MCRLAHMVGGTEDISQTVSASADLSGRLCSPQATSNNQNHFGKYGFNWRFFVFFLGQVSNKYVLQRITELLLQSCISLENLPLENKIIQRPFKYYYMYIKKTTTTTFAIW